MPEVATGKRQILTAAPTPAFKAYQQILETRIKAIEEREGPPEPGDDILLSVITDGRHAAIDLRLVMPAMDNEPANKEERERYRQRLVEYQRRLSSYQSRQGGAFAFADELAEKRRKLREVEEALATSAREDAAGEKIAA